MSQVCRARNRVNAPLVGLTIAQDEVFRVADIKNLNDIKQWETHIKKVFYQCDKSNYRLQSDSI